MLTLTTYKFKGFPSKEETAKLMELLQNMELLKEQYRTMSLQTGPVAS